MNIRKMIATFILGFAMAVGSQLCINHAAYAEDVWVYSNDVWSVYLDSNTVKIYDTRPQYQCLVNIIINENGSQSNFWICGFHPKNGEIIAYRYSRSQGFWERIGPLNTTSEFIAIWKAMQDYL